MYPQADVPLLQLSLKHGYDPEEHLAVGRALAPLRDEGVLVLGSGGATHNLRELDRHASAPPAWAKEFDEWLASALAEGQTEAVLDWETKGPNAHRAHPSPEHFLPLFVALGAAGAKARGERLYQDFTMGGLSMAAFRFAA
jgi:4,5-DOPA dioxygenase extradiol